MITQALLLEYLKYDKETGIVTRIKDQHIGKVGDIVGSLSSNGHLVFKFMGKTRQLHSLIYIMVTGECPEFIDHDNCIKTDNRWINLRPATREQNRANIVAYKNNSLGVKGVMPDRVRGVLRGYKGQVKANGIRYFKSFRVTSTRTEEQALALATEWVMKQREIVHGSFTNHGTLKLVASS